MRERVEDLGRISVLVDVIIDHEMFEKLADTYSRPKDFCNWFFSQPKEFQDGFIHSVPYWADDIKEKLYEIREIARGEDRLNDPDSL